MDPGGNRPGYQGRSDQNRGTQSGQPYSRDSSPAASNDEKTDLTKKETKTTIEGWVREWHCQKHR